MQAAHGQRLEGSRHQWISLAAVAPADDVLAGAQGAVVVEARVQLGGGRLERGIGEVRRRDSAAGGAVGVLGVVGQVRAPADNLALRLAPFAVQHRAGVHQRRADLAEGGGLQVARHVRLAVVDLGADDLVLGVELVVAAPADNRGGGLDAAGMAVARRDGQERSRRRPAHEPEGIDAPADDLAGIATVMPDGFKGMVVATSREACLRYHQALNRARDELVAELDQQRPGLPARPDRALDPDESFMRAAAGQVDVIRGLEFAPVISEDDNDPPRYVQRTDKQRQQAHIASFKLPLGPAGEGRGPVALLIVKSMLLTGFDAPQAQVIYLDRLIQEAELLGVVP